jgi:hypothetical protein
MQIPKVLQQIIQIDGAVRVTETAGQAVVGPQRWVFWCTARSGRDGARFLEILLTQILSQSLPTTLWDLVLFPQVGGGLVGAQSKATW